jgi:membrane-associated phospholipid phosphatase
VSAAPPIEPGARRTLRARLAAGPVGRAIGRLDLAIYRRARTHGHDPAIERPIRAYSRTGEHAALWLVVGAAGMALDPQRRARWRRGMFGIATAYALNTALKMVAQRARPVLDDLPQLIATPTQLSFPSAHASSSFAAARAYSGLLPAAPLYAAAGVMAGSRVYLGVHYPSDIVAGAALGTVVGGLAR